MQITNGTVERTVKPADYEGRRVSLSFALDPGDDADVVIAHVAGLAERHARAVPQQPAPVAVAQVPPTPLPATVGRPRKAVNGALSPESAPPVAVTPPVAVPTVMSPGGFPVTDGVGAIAPTPVSPSEPVPMVPPTPATVAPVSSAAAPTGPSPSPVVGLDPRLTDQALSEACAAKVNGSQDRQATVNALVALRSEYTGNPAVTVAAIPFERRGEFLGRLQAL